MRILEIRERPVSVRSEIRNAVIDFSEMTASAVAVISDIERHGEKVVGYGFNSNGRYAQSGILQSRMLPRIAGAEPGTLLNDEKSNFDPCRIWQIMMQNEKPGGHGDRASAVGAVDMALWDLVAKIEEKPLYRLLAERFGAQEPRNSVEVYAAGGYYYPGKDLTRLKDEIRAYLDSGYRRVKIKIGGESLAQDLRRIEAVLEVVEDGSALAVDANGRFDLPTALEYLEAMTPYGLYWYEEPGDPLDYQLLAEVAGASSLRLATGENLFSHQEVTNLLRYGGLRKDRDLLQMDPSLSYGFVEYLRMLQILEREGWSPSRCVPHGGHQFALHIAAGLGLGGNESYPGVFQPFGGFADRIPIRNGRVELPDVPGIGIEEKAELMDVFRELAA